RMDGRTVHHLHASGNNADADNIRNALAGLLARGEADQQGTGRVRLSEYAHRHLGDHAEQALRAGHEPEQVVTLAVEMLSAEAYDLAIHQHHLDAEYVIGCQTVFEAMHAAGIFRHIAADRAGDLRRRIRGI